MSQQQNPLTLEDILELFRETDRRFKETDLKFQDTDRRFKETDLKFQDTDRRMKITDQIVGSLGSRVGKIVENMIYGDIVSQFQELGYEVTACSQNKEFGKKGTTDSGEIDLLLEDGDVAILIEAKTTLKIDDVREHIKRLEKYRRYSDARGRDTQVRYVGAVAGTVVAENVIKFAHENGLYVIVQTARDVEIVPLPEGFVVKEW